MYDLFLCNNCEKIRDEAKPRAATDIVINTTANLPADQLKPKRQKGVLISTAPKTRRLQSTRPAAVEKSVSADVQLLSTASSLSADPVSPSIEHKSTIGRPELESMKTNADNAIEVAANNVAGNQCETVKLLKQQVDSLQTIVLELKTQVEFLRSALDWTVQRVPSAKPGNGPDP